MKRFHLHVWSGDGLVAADDEGVELEDIGAARNEAVLAAREIMADALRKGHLPIDHRFEIYDETGPILTFPFRGCIDRFA
jgi:hypothetical protein